MEVVGLFLVRFAAVSFGMKVHPVVVILNKIEVARKDSGVCEVVLDFSRWLGGVGFFRSCVHVLSGCVY